MLVAQPSRTLWIGDAKTVNGVVDQRYRDAFAQFGAYQFVVTSGGPSVFVTYERLEDAKSAVEGLHGLRVDPEMAPLRANYTYAETTGSLRASRNPPRSASPARQGLKFFSLPPTPRRARLRV